MTIHTIRVRGHIGAEWSEWLDGLQVSNEANGETRLMESLVDQAALYGVLAKLRDLGLSLLAVTEGATPSPDAMSEQPGGCRPEQDGEERAYDRGE